MSGGKNADKLAAEQRRVRVAELTLDGWTQEAIAAELGVAQGTVSKDLAKVEVAWQAASVRSRDAWKARELAKLDLLDKRAAREFERSCQVSQKRVKRKRKTTGGNAAGDVDEATIADEDRIGDPRFLQVRVQIADRRAKLQGLDAPAKTALTDPSGEHPASAVVLYLPDNGRDAEQPAGEGDESTESGANAS